VTKVLELCGVYRLAFPIVCEMFFVADKILNGFVKAHSLPVIGLGTYFQRTYVVPCAARG
jgi:hypothetical protein